MFGMVVAFVLAAAMFTMIGLAVAARKRAARMHQRLPGQLSAAERRRLYQRLGIDPTNLAGQRHANIVWLDPNVIDRRRTEA